ncbi:unnamed protein product [Aspergillus oryzae var. brunneus]|uniref:Unnamed protein product n=1 Tax=Aspergillus oryzae var. brunneus TaxID=332754 RepID=A0ABQ6LC28_ASPOZ|nr:unnamed protein product [Aspergillus oryzae var. brunneus]
MTPDQWELDIIEAQKAHIDGFALNIAPQDHHTDRALQAAYDAAEKIGNFSLFISFDYLSGGPWPADRVITIVNSYKNRKAQFHYEEKPLVSTFEGVGNAGDWPNIKAATGCLFIPCWTSMGPAGIRNVLNDIDGAFSWDAWPVGAEDKKVTNDLEWMKALSGKPYMMPVAPWFYTNLPRWGKNWLWRGDDLWHYRWKQVIELQPPLVQSGSADGTTGNNPGIGQPEMKPHELSQDKVFVSAFVTEPSEVHVQIGPGPHSVLDAAAPGLNHGSFSFKGQTGPVRISIVRGNREIVATTGPAITEQCAGGVVDWNAYVGSSS